MRTVAVASIVQESNDFSPLPTRYEDFDFVFGEDARARHEGKLTELGGFLHVLRSRGLRSEPVCAGWAVTSGRTAAADFARISRQFTRRLAALKRPDALLFALHGAQTAEGVDDVAGALLGQARRVFGPAVPIVITLDLHANVTRAMVEQVSALVGYQTYPHVDQFETGVRAAELLVRILAGEIRPVAGFCKLPLIVPAENMQTGSGPFGRLMQMAQQWERKGAAAAVSVFGVQPWLDVAEMGCSVVSVTNGKQAAARRQARALGERFWSSRREFEPELTPVDRALRKALRITGGPVVLSEPSDSTGSGSPGDSTAVLKPLLQASLREPAAIFLVDPEAVARAIAAGVGATVRMAIGGKLGRQSRPVAVTGRVRLISDGRWTAQGRGYSAGVETCMGRSVVLEVGMVRVLIAERSAMTVDPELYRSHGIEPQRMKIVVVKSPNGFRAAYEPIARKIFLVDTPGVSTPNLRTLPYRRVPRPIYPLDTGFRWRA